LSGNKIKFIINKEKKNNEKILTGFCEICKRQAAQKKSGIRSESGIRVHGCDDTVRQHANSEDIAP
jgi:hypothetical protein